jgi:DNA topoisomerase I
VCTYLIDKLALRVGNEKGEDEADTVGCCSLRVENIQLTEENRITLDFLGKDSMRYCNTVDVDPDVYKHLGRFCEGKQPRDDIFCKINSGRLNDYLKENMENLSAKVFRTYNASETLQMEL